MIEFVETIPPDQLCDGVANQESMLAIVHQPEPEKCLGKSVLILVGGPQYRVGSHRQFVLLARALAEQGYTVMRLDYLGMGDSTGEKRSFCQMDNEISAAVDRFTQLFPNHQLSLWGLCDAASACLIYAHKDTRIKGMMLANPWLRSDQSHGKTMLKHYYLSRLMSRDFWQKLFSFKVNFLSSVKDAKGFVDQSRGGQQADAASYQERMLQGLQGFSGKVCVMLSDNDLTAREFEDQLNSNKSWSSLKSKLALHRISPADHTFSSMNAKAQVEKVSSTFLQDLV